MMSVDIESGVINPGLSLTTDVLAAVKDDVDISLIDASKLSFMVGTSFVLIAAMLSYFLPSMNAGGRTEQDADP